MVKLEAKADKWRNDLNDSIKPKLVHNNAKTSQYPQSELEGIKYASLS